MTEEKEYRLTEAQRAHLIRLQRKKDAIDNESRAYLLAIVEKLDPPFYPVNLDIATGRLMPGGGAPPIVVKKP